MPIYNDTHIMHTRTCTHNYCCCMGKWEVPIYNDTYVIIFFGFNKKLVSKWLTDDPDEVKSTCMHIYACVYMWVHVCTCVYMYVHVCTCMYEHAYVP